MWRRNKDKVGLIITVLLSICIEGKFHPEICLYVFRDSGANLFYGSCEVLAVVCDSDVYAS